MAKRGKGEGSWNKKNINGIEYWHFRKKYDNKYKDFYGKTKKEVSEKIKNFELSSGNFTFKNIVTITLGKFIYDQWIPLAKQQTLKKTSYDTILDSIRLYVIPKLGNYQLTQLTPTILQEHINNMSKKYSLRTVKKAFDVLNGSLDYALKMDYININPMTKVIKPTESGVAVKKKKILFLDNEDLNALYNESKRLNTKEFRINGSVGKPVYGVIANQIILIAYTGLRISEALALKWSDYNENDKTLTISKNLVLVIDRNKNSETYMKKIYELQENDGKTVNSIRQLPLCDRAIEQLAIIKSKNKSVSENDFIFQTSTGKHPSQANMTRTLSSMLLRSGGKVEKCGLHALRHSYGSYLLSKKVDLKTISVLLGHSDFRLTAQIYLDVTNQQLVDAVDVLNKMNQ
jgi:integrase